MASNIPIGICLTPFNSVAVPTPGHRGGLIYVGDANKDAGGGPLYIANCSGAVAQFDPATGIGTLVTDPKTYGPQHWIRFDGAKAITQPGFNWQTLEGGDPAMWYYTCGRTDGQ